MASLIRVANIILFLSYIYLALLPEAHSVQDKTIRAAKFPLDLESQQIPDIGDLSVIDMPYGDAGEEEPHIYEKCYWDKGFAVLQKKNGMVIKTAMSLNITLGDVNDSYISMNVMNKTVKVSSIPLKRGPGQEPCVPGSNNQIFCSLSYHPKGSYTSSSQCFCRLNGLLFPINIKAKEMKTVDLKKCQCATIKESHYDCAESKDSCSVSMNSESSAKISCVRKSYVHYQVDSDYRTVLCDTEFPIDLSGSKRLTVVCPNGDVLTSVIHEISEKLSDRSVIPYFSHIPSKIATGIYRIFMRPIWILAIIPVWVFGPFLLTKLISSTLYCTKAILFRKALRGGGKNSKMQSVTILTRCYTCGQEVDEKKMNTHLALCTNNRCFRCLAQFRSSDLYKVHMETCKRAHDHKEETKDFIKELERSEIMRSISELRDSKRFRIGSIGCVILLLLIISELPVALAAVVETKQIPSKAGTISIVDVIHHYAPASLSAVTTMTGVSSEPDTSLFDLTFSEEVMTAATLVHSKGSGQSLSIRLDDWATVYEKETLYWTTFPTFQTVTTDFCTGSCETVKSNSSLIIQQNFKGTRHWTCNSLTCLTLRGGCTSCYLEVVFPKHSNYLRVSKLTKKSFVARMTVQKSGERAIGIQLGPNQEFLGMGFTIKGDALNDVSSKNLFLIERLSIDGNVTSSFVHDQLCLPGECPVTKFGSFFVVREPPFNQEVKPLSSVLPSDLQMTIECTVAYGATCILQYSIDPVLDIQRKISSEYLIHKKFSVLDLHRQGILALRHLTQEMSIRITGSVRGRIRALTKKPKMVARIESDDCHGRYGSLSGFSCRLNIELSEPDVFEAHFRSRFPDCSISQGAFHLVKGRNSIVLRGFSAIPVLDSEVEIVGTGLKFSIKGHLGVPTTVFTTLDDVLSLPINHTRYSRESGRPNLWRAFTGLISTIFEILTAPFLKGFLPWIGGLAGIVFFLVVSYCVLQVYLGRRDMVHYVRMTKSA